MIRSGLRGLLTVLFGLVFALNLALNNFSLNFMSIPANLTIRSCLPLTTFLAQQACSWFNLYPVKPCRCTENITIVIGVALAVTFTLASDRGLPANEAGAGEHTAHEAGSQLLGIAMCLASLLCASLNLALAGVLSTGSDRTQPSAMSLVASVAVPCAAFLLPICFVRRPLPGEWSEVFGAEMMSGAEVLMRVWMLNKEAMAWFCLSGVFSFIYNVIQFSTVQALSPTALAFGSSCGKALLLGVMLLCGTLQVNQMPSALCIQVLSLKFGGFESR